MNAIGVTVPTIRSALCFRVARSLRTTTNATSAKRKRLKRPNMQRRLSQGGILIMTAFFHSVLTLSILCFSALLLPLLQRPVLRCRPMRLMSFTPRRISRSRSVAARGGISRISRSIKLLPRCTPVMCSIGLLALRELVNAQSSIISSSCTHRPRHQQCSYIHRTLYMPRTELRSQKESIGDGWEFVLSW
jgi:hypothetical protein